MSHPVLVKGPAVLLPRVLPCAQLFRKRLELAPRSHKATGPQAAGTAFQRSHRASCRNPPYQTPGGVKRYLNAIKRGHSMAGKPEGCCLSSIPRIEERRASRPGYLPQACSPFCLLWVHPAHRPTIWCAPTCRRHDQQAPVPVREFHVTRGASGVEIHFKGVWHLADIDRSN